MNRRGRCGGAVARRAAFSWALFLSATLTAGALDAFPHVVQPGETLAEIAERTYGRVEMEQLLVAANQLDSQSSMKTLPGMLLEIPAVTHHRVAPDETWASLAQRFLGDPNRSDALALANDSMPWLVPGDGQEIIIPYNLRYVVGAGDSTLTIAYRFLGHRDKAWMLDKYNGLDGKAVRRGDVVLVPLTELDLTAEGKTEAASAGAIVRAQGADHAREAQRRVTTELPQLASDVRAGRYVEAVAKGNRMLAYGELSTKQLASIHRELTEAYVALDVMGLAESSCAAWREAAPDAALDPVELSPKILRACVGTMGAKAAAPAPPSSASAEPKDAGGARDAR